eukprot:c43466_g1_i1 orf=341-733(-)
MPGAQLLDASGALSAACGHTCAIDILPGVDLGRGHLDVGQTPLESPRFLTECSISSVILATCRTFPSVSFPSVFLPASSIKSTPCQGTDETDNGGINLQQAEIADSRCLGADLDLFGAKVSNEFYIRNAR